LLSPGVQVERVCHGESGILCAVSRVAAPGVDEQDDLPIDMMTVHL
jgi:hypothetical protein